MEPFNPEATCPKCGYDKVGTQYQAPYHPSCDEFCRDKKPERLERRCERCRYWWGEACVAPPAQAPAAEGSDKP